MNHADRDVHQCGGDKHLRNAKASTKQPGSGQCRHDHKRCVEHVIRGNDARALLRWAFLLHIGVERDHKDTCTH